MVGCCCGSDRRFLRPVMGRRPWNLCISLVALVLDNIFRAIRLCDIQRVDGITCKSNGIAIDWVTCGSSILIYLLRSNASTCAQWECSVTYTKLYIYLLITPFSWFCLCRMQAYTYNSPLLLLAYTIVYRSLKIVKQGQNCTYNVGNPHYGRLNVQSGHTKLFIHWRKQPNTCVELECRVLWTFHTCIFPIQINREVCSEQRQPWKEGCSNTVSRILRLKIGF